MNTIKLIKEEIKKVHQSKQAGLEERIELYMKEMRVTQEELIHDPQNLLLNDKEKGCVVNLKMWLEVECVILRKKYKEKMTKGRLKYRGFSCILKG